MSYIAFFDMLGTRSAAMIGNNEYTSAIEDFNNALKQVSALYPCKVFAYSDNAYVEIDKLEDLIVFFRLLRGLLMDNHRFFTAVVERGSLDCKKISFNQNRGFSMKFTAPATIDIYLKQCDFTGIGISLSQKVIDDIKDKNIRGAVCQSVYQARPKTNIESHPIIMPIYDISYENVSYEQIKYIISDYLLASATSGRAGRYYITPIISMIKSLNKDLILNDLKQLVFLISLHEVPNIFKELPNQNIHSLYFILALIDCVFNMHEITDKLDPLKICQDIITYYNKVTPQTIEIIPSVSPAIISNNSKKMFLSVLYNMNRNIFRK